MQQTKRLTPPAGDMNVTLAPPRKKEHCCR
jgi:hypothetical protein